METPHLGNNVAIGVCALSFNRSDEDMIFHKGDAPICLIGVMAQKAIAEERRSPRLRRLNSPLTELCFEGAQLQLRRAGA